MAARSLEHNADMKEQADAEFTWWDDIKHTGWILGGIVGLVACVIGLLIALLG